MKTQFNLPLLALLAATAMGASSCKKDKESNPAPAKTKTELLAGKDWKLAAQTVTPGLTADDGTVVTDLFPYLDECDKDDLMRYDANGTCLLSEGPTRCDPSNPQQYTGTWSFDSNETILKTNVQGLGSSSFNIIELSDNTLKVSGIRTLTDGDHKFTYTYSKK
ncbi:DUF5004 domain-containing protein [Hymenobacter lucidus]|uniref:DUF5004 domain-containing protein n=1 Tax=Hymenobacter lucidus TaxID=2880930 RepID=A0ABS8ATK0_9BACT|nr:DUF5004 domain-containing protein [Hymenobacter lucidus]MCB2409303.1 DUF5004 domain-containing protein [Hymenobacter lucidus]